ncbi:hypothetical protein ACOME3_008485 [Neoechinorhynchus agilis]
MESEPSTTSVLCKVCGDRSTGRHFGVHTCEACKAFYRRTARQTILSRLISQPCAVRHVINRYNRKECAPCRFDKCLRLGMSRDNCVFGKPSRKISQETSATPPKADSIDYMEVINQALSCSGLIFELELNEQTKYLIATNNRRFLTTVFNKVSISVDQGIKAEFIRLIWDRCEYIERKMVMYESQRTKPLTKHEKAIILLGIFFAIDPNSIIGDLEIFYDMIGCIYGTDSKKELVKYFNLLNEVYMYAFVKEPKT